MQTTAAWFFSKYQSSQTTSDTISQAMKVTHEPNSRDKIRRFTSSDSNFQQITAVVIFKTEFEVPIFCFLWLQASVSLPALQDH